MVCSRRAATNRGVARPAGLGDQEVEAKRGQVVGEGIGLDVPGLVKHLRIGAAIVAGLRLDGAATALDFLQRHAAGLAAGDANGAHVVPAVAQSEQCRYRAPVAGLRSVITPDTGVEPQQGHRPRSGRRSRADAGKDSRETGEIDLQRRRHVERGAHIGHVHATVAEVVRQGLQGFGPTVAQARHRLSPGPGGRRRWRDRSATPGRRAYRVTPIAFRRDTAGAPRRRPLWRPGRTRRWASTHPR